MEILEVIIRRRVPVKGTGTYTNDSTSRSLSGELPEGNLLITGEVQFFRAGSSPPSVQGLELVTVAYEELRS